MLLENVKKLCASRGISIVELEAACDLGKQTVYRWGIVSPSVDKVKRVADYFGVTVDALVGGD